MAIFDDPTVGVPMSRQIINQIQYLVASRRSCLRGASAAAAVNPEAAATSADME